MKIITIVTDNNSWGFNHLLVPSCKYYSIELVILNYHRQYDSHTIKDICLKDYLSSTWDSEIIFFSDAYDTLIVANENEILEKFKKFNCPLVFSSEHNCWPFEGLSKKYKYKSYYNNYLNSGGFIGEASYVKYLLEKYTSSPSHYNLFEKLLWSLKGFLSREDSNPDYIYKWSNQYYWHNVYLSENDKIKIDHNCDIFYTLSTKSTERRYINKADSIALYYALEVDTIFSNIKIINNRIQNIRTSTFPCHIHFNGPVPKSLMENKRFETLQVWK